MKAPKTGFVTPDGKSVSVAELLAESDGLPVLVAIFKKSCPVCKLAWPYLQRVHEAYGGKAVRVVGVSQNDLASSREFYAEFGGATFDLLLDPEPGFAASNAFDVEAVPHIALLEADGSMPRVFEGWNRKEMEALGSDFAGRKGLPFVPVVEASDPVPAWKSG